MPLPIPAWLPLSIEAIVLLAPAIVMMVAVAFFDGVATGAVARDQLTATTWYRVGEQINDINQVPVEVKRESMAQAEHAVLGAVSGNMIDSIIQPLIDVVMIGFYIGLDNPELGELAVAMAQISPFVMLVAYAYIVYRTSKETIHQIIRWIKPGY